MEWERLGEVCSEMEQKRNGELGQWSCDGVDQT